MNVFPRARISGIVQHETGDELLLYNLLTNKACCLNEISSGIYYLCNGKNDIASIADKMKLPDEIVKIAVSDLSKQNLLTERIEIQTSRRDLLRNIALSSIALPVITTLIAPTAARAASTCGTVPPGIAFTIPNNGGGTSSCFTSANDAQCQSCRVNAAACANPACSSIACTCR